MNISPINSGALRARAKILYGSLEIDGISLFQQGDRKWCQLPAEPICGEDGAIIKNDKGKPVYKSALKWWNWETQQQFSAEVWGLVESALGAAPLVIEGTTSPALPLPPPRRAAPGGRQAHRANRFAAPRLPMRQGAVPDIGFADLNDRLDDIGR